MNNRPRPRTTFPPEEDGSRGPGLTAAGALGTPGPTQKGVPLKDKARTQEGRAHPNPNEREVEEG
jgi:hypothetical protein